VGVDLHRQAVRQLPQSCGTGGDFAAAEELLAENLVSAARSGFFRVVGRRIRELWLLGDLATSGGAAQAGRPLEASASS
jgi:hypothetical protein